jgi:hypothetical protein
MKITTLAAAAVAVLFTSVSAAPADAQGMRERTVVRTTTVRHGAGMRDHHRRKVCRVTVRRHMRHRVCTWR